MGTTNRIVVAVNVGSSSVKCALFASAANLEPLARGSIDAGPAAPAKLIAWVDERTANRAIAAVGHRIVHGGARYYAPQLITSALREDLRALIPFAPNHLPAEMALVDELATHWPGIPQVACFDTAFHQRMPEVARRLPIPAEFHDRGVLRYGFHGLSYEFLLEELARTAGADAARGRVILAHLGNGSSLAAVRQGIGIDTTMALTPIGGVVMSTRSGDLDPGVVTYMARTARLSPEELEEVLSKRSGLFGLSGTTGDMQQLLRREGEDPAARLAVESYVYSVSKAIGAFAAVLRGLDTLVFSGGIGEHAAAIRARVCDAVAFAGVALDSGANDRHAPLISAATSRVAVRVIPTNEELMIARATCRASEAG